jgi:glycyl-tRNA synthetase beta chain
VTRIEKLSGEIARTIGADVEKAKLAARLSKADLVTGMVGEFPELQGLMGRYYALDQGVDPEVADAIRDHYKPVGPSDTIPVSKVGQPSADKLDSVGLRSTKPTGSKDPYALRRAALGVLTRASQANGRRLRLVPSNRYRNPKDCVSLFMNAHEAASEHIAELRALQGGDPITQSNGADRQGKRLQPASRRTRRSSDAIFRDSQLLNGRQARIVSELMGFFADRLKVYLKEQGRRHDLIDAVFALGNQDDLVMIVRRVEALSKFLETDDGKNLLSGIKRASNILRIEEKKDAKSYDGDVHISQLIKGEEKALHSAITQAVGQARRAVEAEDFEGAMSAIARLRAPVDAFFEHVTVNDKDATFRENRLRLLNRIRAATAEVADFSKIEGVASPKRDIPLPTHVGERNDTGMRDGNHPTPRRFIANGPQVEAHAGIRPAFARRGGCGRARNIGGRAGGGEILHALPSLSAGYADGVRRSAPRAR